MFRPLPLHGARRTASRASALALVLALLLSPAAAGPPTAAAAPAAQAQGLCSLVPAGYDPSYLDDRPDYCYAAYVEADGTTLNLKLFKAATPELAYTWMDPKPDDCAAGMTFNGAPCAPVDKGDVAPPGAGHTYKGVSWKGGQGYAWRRGCYLLVGETLWSTQAAKDKQWALMLKADALLNTSACPGCTDPNACQGAGSTSVCGAGVPPPAGRFAVSGYGCQYEEVVDGVTCQAAVVNACPDADLWYEWSLDGKAAPGYTGDLFNPTGLGLCAGDHTVSVYAVDIKNNLTATGISWTFRGTQGPPCGGAAGAGLSVSTPSCTYLSAEDRILCTVQVVDAPPGADIEYEWKWNGAVQAETGAMLDILVPADFQIHTFEVTARDRAGGTTSSPASTTVQVGQPPLVTRPEYIQVETRNGLFEIPGLDGSKSTLLEALAGDDAARLFAICPELYKVELMWLAYSEEMRSFAHWDVPIVRLQVVITSVLLKCAAGLVDAGWPLEVAAVGDPVLFLPAQAAPEDLPVQLRIEMLGGPLRVHTLSDRVLVDVQTAEASIRSAGENDFGVAFDPQTGDTTVGVFDGTVEVYSMGSALRLAALEAGEQVTVSRGGVSEVTRTSGGGGARSLLIGVGCLAGLVLVAALVVWAVVRSRRQKGGAVPGRAASAAPTPVQVAGQLPPERAPATPPAGPRLVVALGTARPASVALSGGLVTIGRDLSNTLVVDDPLVVDRHAQVSLEGRFWVLQDLGSASGTFLAGVRIQRQALRPGDRIQVGRTVIQFQA